MLIAKTQDLTKHDIDVVTYSANGASHNIVVVDKVCPDLVLVHQSKMFGFFLKTGTALADITLEPVPRQIKDMLR